ncbi:hypothetical protein ED312_06580 [Sinomicrobium pectinilyticum]|uniref:Uncharacterized protein n=1 Tax=Sinomicrobium pectinilyticum TaxID=1084421 RepID=A0A3N0EQR3_SINP1|nr:hypothetical protein [Sinomicrobium pectinilyticum]RNL90087.1 hypothetical protein ED312_06580 [Sinomicrobium pectinilyticum]
MKKLSVLQKVLLSIFPALGIIFFVDTFFFQSIPHEVFVTMWWILLVLMVIHNIALIIRIWKAVTEAGTKFIFIFLVLSIILFHPIYVWILDDKYCR